MVAFSVWVKHKEACKGPEASATFRRGSLGHGGLLRRLRGGKVSVQKQVTKHKYKLGNRHHCDRQPSAADTCGRVASAKTS